MDKNQAKINRILQIWLFSTVLLMLLGIVLVFSNDSSLIDISVSDSEYNSLLAHSKAGACLGDFTNDGIVDVEDLSFFIKNTGFSPSTADSILLTGESLALNLDTQDTNYWDVKDYLIFEKNFEEFSAAGPGKCSVFRLADIQLHN
ncbi:hypothetical protein KC678_04115 [Candidatus Dojkabacteria bacterium]|uniref:Dockerin domain-containing protein n=1 Tax=Candidatus Dojkabacteria bacterium TaxID=2099670 RepID=A0A955L203_9BACT|nr:hypothetical protein [Candidatus Dojkabacteria bacterium]